MFTGRGLNGITFSGLMRRIFVGDGSMGCISRVRLVRPWRIPASLPKSSDGRVSCFGVALLVAIKVQYISGIQMKARSMLYDTAERSYRGWSNLNRRDQR